MQATIQLSEEQIRQYHDQGFLSLPALTTPEEIELMREAYDRIFAERAGRERGDQFDLAGSDEEGKQAALPQILSPSKYAPELANLQAWVNAKAIASQLLGGEAIYSGDHAILKPAGHGAPTPWHQDEAYWDPMLEYQSMSFWMPLQEANEANGCMQFVPGSHKLEVLEHHSINHDPRVHGLETDGVDETQAVACPLPPGGCTIHDSRTLHYAGPNRSDVPRRAYIMVFGLEPSERKTPRSFPWNDKKKTARDARAREAGDPKVPGASSADD